MALWQMMQGSNNVFRGMLWRRFGTGAAATIPKMKAYAPTIDQLAGDHRYQHQVQQSKGRGKAKGDSVPVYVALGMIAVSLTLGLLTAKQQLLYAPDVRVRKSKRKTLPELEEPDLVARESERFFTKSFFRKVAHAQQQQLLKDILPVPDRDRIQADILTRQPRVEALPSVGVDLHSARAH
ncbi:hypothetical protein Ancab_034186 [Ancistrocladus abbreviatus]